MSEPTNCYAAIIKYIAHLWRRSRRRTLKWYREKYHRSKAYAVSNALAEVPKIISLRYRRSPRPSRSPRSSWIPGQENVKANNIDRSTHASANFQHFKGPPKHIICNMPTILLSDNQKKRIHTKEIAPRASPEISDVEISSPGKKDSLVNQEFFQDASTSQAESELHYKSSEMNFSKETLSPVKCSDLSSIGQVQSTSKGNYCVTRQFYKNSSKSERHCSAPTLVFLRPTPSPTIVTIKGELPCITETVTTPSPTIVTIKGELPCITETVTVRSKSHNEPLEWRKSDYSWDEDESEIDDECKSESKCFSVWRSIQSGVKLLVNHNYFKRAIFLAILFNTLSMGIEYHNQPASLTQAVEISNIIFTGIRICISIHHFT